MSKVNITQAAKLAGISRTTLYNTYIKTGQISVSKDGKGNKQIDTSELIRVFSELQTEQLDSTVERPVEHPLTPSTEQIEQVVRIAELETENRLMKERMDELKEQQKLDREQIRDLNTKLLEFKPPPRVWYQFWK